MAQQLPGSIPLDDLQEGKRYHILYDNGSFVRGEFGSFICAGRGHPLRILVPRPEAKEVVAIPVERLVRITPI